MVVLLDLDDKDAYDPHAGPLRLAGYPTPIRTKVTKPSTVTKSKPINDERPNSNNNGFSAALGCYP